MLVTLAKKRDWEAGQDSDSYDANRCGRFATVWRDNNIMSPGPVRVHFYGESGGTRVVYVRTRAAARLMAKTYAMSWAVGGFFGRV